MSNAKNKAIHSAMGDKKYDVNKGSATWRHKMREAYKKGGMKAPKKFDLN